MLDGYHHPAPPVVVPVNRPRMGENRLVRVAVAQLHQAFLRLHLAVGDEPGLLRRPDGGGVLPPGVAEPALGVAVQGRIVQARAFLQTGERLVILRPPEVFGRRGNPRQRIGIGEIESIDAVLIAAEGVPRREDRRPHVPVGQLLELLLVVVQHCQAAGVDLQRRLDLDVGGVKPFAAVRVRQRDQRGQPRRPLAGHSGRLLRQTFAVREVVEIDAGLRVEPALRRQGGDGARHVKEAKRIGRPVGVAPEPVDFAAIERVQHAVGTENLARPAPAP